MVEGSRQTCSAVTRDGKSCSARPRPGADRCPWHDDALSARRREWSAKGGAARSTAARVKKSLPDEALTAAEMQGLVGRVLRQVIAGEITPGIGNCVANLARALVTVREATELEGRLRSLEERAGLREPA